MGSSACTGTDGRGEFLHGLEFLMFAFRSKTEIKDDGGGYWRCGSVSGLSGALTSYSAYLRTIKAEEFLTGTSKIFDVKCFDFEIYCLLFIDEVNEKIQNLKSTYGLTGAEDDSQDLLDGEEVDTEDAESVDLDNLTCALVLMGFVYLTKF